MSTGAGQSVKDQKSALKCIAQAYMAEVETCKLAFETSNKAEVNKAAQMIGR